VAVHHPLTAQTRKFLDFSPGVVYDGATPEIQPAMDIIKALRELHAERKRLNILIASLEAQSVARKRGAPQTLGRRGRKSMSAAERLEVSRRMTMYWEARRAQQSNATSASAS
jgi:hypothetical protein